jgi:sugar lactone lactonase YvrE
MTLPLTFLAGHVIQTVLGHFNWVEARQKGGLLLGGTLLLVPAALATVITAQPFQSQSLQSIDETLQFLAGLVILLALIGVIVYFAMRMGRALALRVAFITAFVLMSLLTIRFAWLFNYVNYDYVNEMLVYAHASPDVKMALEQIDEISRRTVGDKMIRLAYDNDSTWPLEWYLREYPNRVYYGENPTREALDVPVVIVGSANESKVKPYLGDKYTHFNYRLVWWPVEDYKGQTPRKLWENYVAGPPASEETAGVSPVRDNWRKLWNIIFYRHFEDYNLNEWPFVHRFNVYIRNDILNEVWGYQNGPVSGAGGGAAANLDPYNGKRTETSAMATWGSNGSGDGQFITPRDVAVGPDGSIYVADAGNHRIQVFDQDGKFLLKWGSQGAGPGQFNEPWGIAVGKDGTVFVADTWNHRIQAFTSKGEFLKEFGAFANVQTSPQTETGNFWGPRDLAIDSAGNIYVTDTGNKRVQKFTPSGQFLQAWGGGGIIPGAFEEPVGIDIDSQDNIYVADTWNQRIQKFDSNFNPLAQWNVVGWDSESVTNKPYLTVDEQGRVIISDPEGYRLIAYDGNTGEVLVTWGQYGQDLASMTLPNGLDVDSTGNLLVADADGNRIMKFTIPSLSGQ